MSIELDWFNIERAQKWVLPYWPKPVPAERRGAQLCESKIFKPSQFFVCPEQTLTWSVSSWWRAPLEMSCNLSKSRAFDNSGRRCCWTDQKLKLEGPGSMFEPIGSFDKSLTGLELMFGGSVWIWAYNTPRMRHTDNLTFLHCHSLEN